MKSYLVAMVLTATVADVRIRQATNFPLAFILGKGGRFVWLSILIFGRKGKGLVKRKA